MIDAPSSEAKKLLADGGFAGEPNYIEIPTTLLLLVPTLQKEDTVSMLASIGGGSRLVSLD